MFYSTNDAVAFGLQMDNFDRMKLEGLRHAFNQVFERAMRKNLLDLASWMATKSQFCSEALSAVAIAKKYPHMF